MNNTINPTYKVGDKVRVINYGGLVDQIMGNGEIKKVDLASEIVGKEGVIVQIINQQGVPKYKIEGIPMKTAWYDEEQLELVDQKFTDLDQFIMRLPEAKKKAFDEYVKEHLKEIFAQLLDKELKEDFITIAESAAAKRIKEDDEVISNIPGTDSKSFWITVEKDYFKDINPSEDANKAITTINMELESKVKYDELPIAALREVTIEVRNIRRANAPRYEKRSKLLESLIKDVAFMYGDDLMSTLSCIDTLLRNEVVRRFINNELN